MPDKNRFTFDLPEVIEAEWRLINARRVACQSGEARSNSVDATPKLASPQSRPEDLVGLALSGGGIRSASLSLGLVQALDAHGVMRDFDYLSTVSGGGYLGGYLSSSAAAACLSEKPSSQSSSQANSETIDEQPACASASAVLYPTLHEASSGDRAGQPDRVLRFIYGGKYLYKPWQLANKYLIGLFFNVLVLGSGLVFACSTIAAGFRLLDTQWVRDFAEPVGLNCDTDMLFLPFTVLLAGWLVAWGISYGTRKAEAPGQVAQLLLYLVAGAFLVGCTLILVNGQTSLNFAAQAIFGESKITHDGTVRSILLTIIVGGLIPFLKPRAIVQRGLHPKGLFDRALFRFSCVCLLVGVPLILVGYFGMQNISQTAPSADFDFRPGEIYDWGSFSSLLLSDNGATTVGGTANAQDQDPEWQQGLIQTLHEFNGLRNEVRHGSTALAENHIWDVRQWPTIWREAIAWWPKKSRLECLESRICDEVNIFVMTSPHVCISLASQVPAAEGAEQKPALADAIKLTSKPTTTIPLPAPCSILPAIAQFSSSSQLEKSNELDRTALETIRGKLVENSAKTLDATTATATGDALEGVRQALLSYHDFNDYDRKELNQNLLLALRPECFGNLSTIHRDVVTEPDEYTRRKWMAFSGLFFLGGLLVDLNATSLHRFYRNRLDFAYLEHKPDQSQFKLSELDSTPIGAPYHLINASLNRFDSRFGYLFEEFSRERRDGEPDRRSTVNFLFSQLYCGSSVTKYVKSTDFEEMMSNPLLLADAIAMSGAAVEPLQFDFAPLAWMMTSLNLRLGQWLPNPSAQTKRPFTKYTPNVFTVLRDAPRDVEKRRLSFISDGGFSENLGVLPLLRRRCRIIVALDAGHDPDLSFEDLTKTIRLAKVREGISIKKLVKDEGKEEELDTAALRKDTDGNSHRHWIVALINYPTVNNQPAEAGLLIYIKPSFTGDEGADLLAYRAQHPEFPQDTTADQIYGESRVEAYRELGIHIGDQICEQLLTGDATHAIKRQAISGVKFKFEAVRKAALADTWADPPPMPKSLEQIANSLRGVTLIPREDHAHKALGAVNELVTVSTRLLKHSETPEEIYSDISDAAKKLAVELGQAGSDASVQLITDQLIRLAESWEALSHPPASGATPQKYDEFKHPPEKVGVR